MPLPTEANLFTILSVYCSMISYFFIIPCLLEVSLALTSAMESFFTSFICSSVKEPLSNVILRPLYSLGLWLAVTISAPLILPLMITFEGICANSE